MNSLLVINSSARSQRSITRRLTHRFTEGWQTRFPTAQVVSRDLGTLPPKAINDVWIAAAFADAPTPSENSDHPLASSNRLIDELLSASTVVIGAPMYNFGMPASLKAYFDQIVRIGRTFAFDPDAANPYIPLVPAKPVVVITSKGAGGYEQGGPYASLNFLEPHIESILAFIGLTAPKFIRVEYEEFQDERLQEAIAQAEKEIENALRSFSEDQRW